MNKPLIINYLKAKHFLCFALLLFIFQSFLIAQPSPAEVVRSKDKVLIEGKVYFIHVVKKGETIYSIAKAYNVSQTDLLASNPTAKELKTDQALRIPEKATHGDDLEMKNSENFIWHVVLQGQTLFSIAKMYNTTISVLEKTNPELKYDSLQINQVIKIPVTKPETTTPQAQSKATPPFKEALITDNESVIDTSKYCLHKVEPQETLYSLSKKYNVSQECIVAANEIVNNELKSGQLIKIPKKESKPLASNGTAQTKPIIEKKNDEQQLNCDSNKTINTERTIRISLLLPFFSQLAEASTEPTGTEEDNNEEKLQLRQTPEFSPVSANFIEFYQGALIAIDQLKAKGAKIELHVFDTEKSGNRINEILASTKLKNSDLIIGPIFPEHLKPVADFAKENAIYMISPISNRIEITNENPLVYQVNPGNLNEENAMFSLIKQHTEKNIIFLYSSSPAVGSRYDEFKTELLQKASDNSIKISDLAIYNNDFTHVEKLLDSTRQNIVISPVDDEIFASNLTRNLKVLNDQYPIQVIGSAEWSHYKSIDLDFLYTLQYTYVTTFYTDYYDENVRNFLKMYRIMFGTEPFRMSHYGFNYSMLGYDVFSYFITAFGKYGSEFNNNTDCLKMPLTASDFKFRKTSGGYINSSFIVVQYTPNYTIVKSKLTY